MMDGTDAALAIRAGRPDDYPAALEVQRRAYAEKEAPLYGKDIPPLRETPDSLAAEIAEGKTLVLGEIDGTIVASVRMKTLGGGAVYFGRLSVDPAFQGRGIGQRMALAVEELNPGAHEFILDCGIDSLENLHIYHKLGYRETGSTIQVQDGPKCVEMTKTRKRI